MIFNSWTFGAFFFIVYLLYLHMSHHRQNILLLIVSWVFYGFWDWRFLFLLWTSITVDYFIGRRLSETVSPIQRRALITLSVFIFYIKTTILYLA